jgi:hypothetical protein
LAFLTQHKAKLCKNLIVFEKNAIFFAEKSPKIAIITLNPGSNPTTLSYNASALKLSNAANSMAHF